MPRVTKATNKKDVKSTGISSVKASSSTAKKEVKKEKDIVKKDVLKEEKKITVKSPAKKASSKVASKTPVKKTTTKKTAVKATPIKDEKKQTKSVTKKVVSKVPSKAVKKKESVKDSKKVVTSKSTKKASSKATKKASTKDAKKLAPKKTAKKAVTKLSRSTSKGKKVVSKKSKVHTLEYYDLPYRYNQTIVKILAQTPNTLFVYWDISDKDREKYVKEFGEYFFNDTIPVLIVHNKTKNYYFEIEVNDFANSWYFHVSDANCDYEIEFGRRKKAFRDILIPNDYVYITSSNVIEAPNDRFLFEPNNKTIFFRNVKTNQEFSKDITTFSFMEKISRIYNIYDIYKEIYKEDDLIDAMNNPTSSGSGLSFYQKN